MVCIYCAAPTQVVNSRLQRRANHIWRRRKCVGCGAVFTTEERAALHSSLMIENTRKQLLPFSRDHLFASVHDSCKHRPTGIDDATALTHTIIAKLMSVQQDGVVHLHDIARTAHQVLARFDRAAAAVYAAYHPAALQPATKTARTTS
jgi:transcriptional regulator NrdR family protein